MIHIAFINVIVMIEKKACYRYFFGKKYLLIVGTFCDSL